jgi:hypothetical protein
MPFLAFLLAAVALPYAVERLYFGKRFGLFAALFWVYVFQVGILFLLKFLDPQWTPPFGLEVIFKTIGVVAFLGIAAVPAIALFCSALLLLVYATRWIEKRMNPDAQGRSQVRRR